MKNSNSQYLEEKTLNTVQQYRKANGLSQDELARLLKVRRATISDWENGVRMPRFNNVKKLAEIFKIDTRTLAKDFMDIYSQN